MRLFPRLSIKKNSIVLPNLTMVIFLTYVLLVCNLINLGNYSFLSFSFSGQSNSNIIGDLIKYSRLPLLIGASLILMLRLIDDIDLRKFFISNVDVIIFVGSLYLGLANALDVFNGVNYSLWHTCSIFVLLGYLYYLRETIGQSGSIRFIFQFLFWSNFIILLLLFTNLPTLGSSFSYSMAFSSKSFYAYSLLTLVICILSCRVISKESLFRFRYGVLFEWVVVISCLFFCFISARRTPLFLMFIILLIYQNRIFGNQLYKRVFLICTLLFAIIVSTPIILKNIKKYNTELSVLYKINNLINSNGNLEKDSSYSERLKVWKIYRSIFQTHPIVGVGSFNGPLYSKAKFSHLYESKYSPHNLYLGILVEHGVLGMFFFIIVVLRSEFIFFTKMGFIKFAQFNFYFVVPILVINWNEYNLIPGQVFYWTTMIVFLMPRVLTK